MPNRMQRLTTEQDVDALFAEERAILYKHSTRCPISSAAYDQVEMFLQRCPDAPVYIVDVIMHRSTSRYAAEKCGIRHHSPQVIFLREGVAVWDTSHDGVTAREMAQRWDELRAGSAAA